MIANLREDLIRAENYPATLSRMRESRPSRTTNALYQYVNETESSVNGFETENVLRPPGERESNVYTQTRTQAHIISLLTRNV